MEKQTIIETRKKHLYPTKKAMYKDPLHLVKAQGSYAYDDAGNKYFDAIGGIVSISVGHNHPEIVAELKRMLDDGEIQHTTFLYLSRYMAELSESIAKVAPGDLDRVYLTNSGSEANEMAVMTAREVTGQQTVVALRHGYHGGTNQTLGLCGHSTWKYHSQPQPNVVHAKAPYCYRCPFGATAGKCSLECAEDVKETIETATSGKPAAIIVEPVMGVGGFIDPPLEYHKKVYDIIKSFGGLYISDEVQTGVGRTGEHFFAIEESGVTPDFITMAKGLGSGAPVGGVVTKKEYAAKMDGKAHFNTFGGDPFQSMQANKVIEIILRDNLIGNSKTQGAKVKTAMQELQKDYPWIGDVRGRGLMVGLELVKDPKTKEHDSARTLEFLEVAKQNGLLVGKGGLYGNVVRIAPSLDLTNEQTDELIDKLSKTIKKLGES